MIQVKLGGVEFKCPQFKQLVYPPWQVHFNESKIQITHYKVVSKDAIVLIKPSFHSHHTLSVLNSPKLLDYPHDSGSGQACTTLRHYVTHLCHHFSCHQATTIDLHVFRSISIHINSFLASSFFYHACINVIKKINVNQYLKNVS